MLPEIELREDGIYISERSWARINSLYSREYIKSCISDFIDTHELQMPMVNISQAEAEQSLAALIEIDDKELLIDAQWRTRYPYDPKWFQRDQVAVNCKVGNKFPNYYHQENRWHCDSINSPSPYRSWGVVKFRLTLLNALWSLNVTHVSTTVLRSCIGMRKYIASQFRPSAAKAIYNHFEAANVLDISSGWGDRLAGFMASNATGYTGIDPNSNLVAGYRGQVKAARKLGIRKYVDMVNECSEDVYYTDKFNLVFTSPPYYRAERYTHEGNQSFLKFRELEHWLDGYLFTSLKSAWEALETGGHLVLNLSDVYLNHRINKLCDPANEFIGTLSGAQYIGAIGYQMAVRPRSAAQSSSAGVFCEPMWCWRKD